MSIAHCGRMSWIINKTAAGLWTTHSICVLIYIFKRTHTNVYLWNYYGSITVIEILIEIVIIEIVIENEI